MSLHEVRGMGDERGNEREREKDTRSSVWGCVPKKTTRNRGRGGRNSGSSRGPSRADTVTGPHDMYIQKSQGKGRI